MKNINKCYNMPALLVEVTRMCNNKCNYCADWRNNAKQEETISMDDYEILFKAAKKMNFSRVTFTGGEPTLSKKFINLLKLASEIIGGENIHITTNGTLILENKEIWSIPVGLVKININSINPSKYKEITKNDKLPVVLDGVKYLKKRNIPLRLHAVISESNYNSILELIDWCIENGIDLKLFEIDTSLSTYDKARIDASKIDKYVYIKSKINELINSPGLPIKNYSMEKGNEIQIVQATKPKYNKNLCFQCDRYPCDYGLYTVSVNPQGICYPCLINTVLKSIKLSFSNEDKVIQQLEEIRNIILEAQSCF